MKDRDDWQLTPDGVARALAHLMPRSAGAVVREAFYGATRFDEFLRRTALPRSVLATQLESLTRNGMLVKAPYREAGDRAREEYRLTERGRSMGVALVALIDWSRRWLPEETAPSAQPVHVGCGAVVHAALRCEAGHDDLEIADVEAVVVPGATAD